MESVILRLAGDIVGLAVVLVMVWWRLDKMESHFEKLDEQNHAAHSEMWKQIRENETDLATHQGAHAGLASEGPRS